MSLGSGPMSPKRWRPWEQAGWAVGIGAGGLVLVCLWIFSLSWQIAGAVVPARSKRNRP